MSAPLTLEAREARLLAVGAAIHNVSDGTGVGTPVGDFPRVVPACLVRLADGREFEAGGRDYDEAQAAAFAQAEAALGV